MKQASGSPTAGVLPFVGGATRGTALAPPQATDEVLDEEREQEDLPPRSAGVLATTPGAVAQALPVDAGSVQSARFALAVLPERAW